MHDQGIASVDFVSSKRRGSRVSDDGVDPSTPFLRDGNTLALADSLRHRHLAERRR